MTSSFTSEEIEIIEGIKKGTKELIENILLNKIESPKEYANRQSLTKIKPTKHTFLIHEIIQIFRKDKNYIFRPHDLKKRLPDSLKIIENYDYELTRILQSLVRSKLIVPSSKLPKKRHPGRMKNDEAEQYTISGPKSYYEASPFLIRIITITNNPEARKIIYSALSKDNILFEFYKRAGLIYPNLLLQNKMEATKMIRDSIKLETKKTESEFEKQFQEDTKKIKTMKKKDITQKYKYWAKMKLNNLTSDDFLWLYPLGASYYIRDIISINADY